jgi:Uma2 family endonuclease
MALRKPTPAAKFGGSRESDDWTEFAGRRMPVEEFLALDDAEETDLEYVDGVVVAKPVVGRRHGRIVTELAARIWLYQQRRGGESGPERRVRVGVRRFLKPDLAVYAPGWSVVDDAIPTLAIEVRSPGETLASMRRKCAMYCEAGVAVCWIIDPIRRQAEVFEREREGERLPADGALESEHLPAFRLPLAELCGVLD